MGTRVRLLLLVGALALLVASFGSGCATTTQLPAGQRSPATGTPTPPPSPLATATPLPGVQCPTNTGDLTKIRPGGMGADATTFASVWGPEDGSPAPGALYAFGRYSDSAIDKVTAQAGPLDRVYGMDYHADTSQTLTLPQATHIVTAQILPADAAQLASPQPGGASLTVQYCSPAFAAAFPANAGLPQNGFIWVTYFLRPTGDVDHMRVSPSAPCTPGTPNC